MSYLAVYHVCTPDTPNKVLTHLDDIVATLAEHGVRFQRWQPCPIEKGASDADMIAAYQQQPPDQESLHDEVVLQAGIYRMGH